MPTSDMNTVTMTFLMRGLLTDGPAALGNVASDL